MLRSELAVLLAQLPDLEPVDTAEAIAALVELATGDVSGRGAAAAGAAAQRGTTTTPHLHRRPLRTIKTKELSEAALDGPRTHMFGHGRRRTFCG